jgi:hypothetical protein
LGVVNEGPVPSEVPPVEAANQLIVPAEQVAPKLTVPAPHRVPGIVPVIEGTVLTEAVTVVLEVVVHPFRLAST